MVDAEALQGALGSGADVGRAAVDDAGPASGVRHQAELRRYDEAGASLHVNVGCRQESGPGR
jgi:hypothetical protein